MMARIAFSAFLSASVTGSKTGCAVDDRPLVGHVDALAEIGPDDLAGRVGEPVGEGDGFGRTGIIVV